MKRSRSEENMKVESLEGGNQQIMARIEESSELKICLKVPKKISKKSEISSTFENFDFKSRFEAKKEIFCIQRKPKKKEVFSRYSRKEKSLGQLSKKFLKIFGKMKNQEVSLDSVTSILGVERRRIYDIINILESLGVVFRRGKNHYYWFGLIAISQKISNLMLKISKEGLDLKKIKKPGVKQKSLGFLAIGFIKLFIGWRSIITLEQAAQSLTLREENHKLKTKIRRLYDIANVFLALGIIKKSYLPNRKPAFQWLGLVGLDKLLRTVSSEKILSPVDISCQEYTLNKLRKSVSLQNVDEKENVENPGKLWKCHELKLKKVLSEDREVMELLKGVELPNLKPLEISENFCFQKEFSPIRLPMTQHSAFVKCSNDGQKNFNEILSEILNSNHTPKHKKINFETNSTACKSTQIRTSVGQGCKGFVQTLKIEKVSNVLFERNNSSSFLGKRTKRSFQKISEFGFDSSPSKKIKVKSIEVENIFENLMIKMQ